MGLVTEQINAWTAKQMPYFFLWDFEGEQPFACPLTEAYERGIYFDVEEIKNYEHPMYSTKKLHFQKSPVSLAQYAEKFKKVQAELCFGNTYLINLTDKTKIESSHTLEELFHLGKARFKLYVRDQFVSFSPEPFVTISEGQIATFPMKGTIRANLPDATQRILTDPKEAAEHATIVDLLRNDLSLVATQVRVKQYRYLEKVQNEEGGLLQVSSKVTGKLKAEFTTNFGDLFNQLLPAGSISGAPKKKTLSIIRETEKEKRGYFTGVFGIFDGKTLKSAVLIRYLEKTEDGLYFRSGGGITAQSDFKAEYEEMIQKVYVPIS